MDENEVKTSESINEDNVENPILNNIEDNEQSQTQEEIVNQEESVVANQAIQVQEQKYSIQEFIENSKALGYKKEVVSGALFNCEKTELMKTEFETRVKNFLGKKVE